MAYDLRRLHLAGLIHRIDHTNRYVLTPDGTRFAIFYTKLHNRLLRLSWPPGSPRHPRCSARPCTPSTSTSTNIAHARLGKAHVKTRHNFPGARDQGSLVRGCSSSRSPSGYRDANARVLA